MNRAFTTREKTLMLILVILLLATGYYWVVAMPVQDRITAANAADASAQDEIMVESVRAKQLRTMQEELESAKSNGEQKVSSIPDYDNLENVMIQLDAILTPASTYTLNFSDVGISDQLVNRPISMTFTCANYQAARGIIDSLYNCVYRCTLDNISMSAIVQDRSGTPDLNQDGVSVSLLVTFYEKY